MSFGIARKPGGIVEGGLIGDRKGRSSALLLQLWTTTDEVRRPIISVLKCSSATPVMLRGIMTKGAALTCSKMSEPQEAELLLNPHTPMNALPW